MLTYHIHHIIPRHMGGTDDPTNLVRLTVEEHAEEHRLLYEKYGKREDWLAWQGLSKLIGKDEIIREAYRLGNKKSIGRKHTQETRLKISKAKMGNIPGNKGKKVSPEKINLSGLLSDDSQKRSKESKRKRLIESGRTVNEIEADKLRSLSLKGKPKSEEHRKALSNNKKAFYAAKKLKSADKL